jgi:squalene-hopene/tetraprenyl-beta-curcumene cyclase
MTDFPQSQKTIVHRVRQSLDKLRDELLEQRTPEGYWVGQLSPSSLSTATAISAISAFLIHAPEGAVQLSPADSTPPTLQVKTPSEPQKHRTTETQNGDSRVALIDAVKRGIDALREQQNPDGGFGDTDRSHSNIATSYLVLAATSLAGQATGHSLSEKQTDSLKQYIQITGGFDALKKRYGTDKTFVVPILTNLAIAGIVSWDQVPSLPFEAAAFPQSMYRMLSMPVVSYAIPALVAIGQTRHFHGPKAFAPLRLVRGAMIKRTMQVLRRMQPDSGGFLEATPLTAFVVMSLSVTKRTDHEVSKHGLRFLLDSIDQQGLWPIDTNLATWVTSLAMHALSCDPEDDGSWCSDSLIDWHLKCQHLTRHPFTGAEPGGWGWSDLSGAVPDSDDTPAAILALAGALRWKKDKSGEIHPAIERALGWLNRLQNRNGGWPTFCKGWGKLPFDRSSNDLTAHALRALQASASIGILNNNHAGIQRAKKFLTQNQQPDGSWHPLWFGNQDREDEENPIYGTSKVLTAAVHFLDSSAVDRGCKYLLSQQNPDGGWGGGSSLNHWLERSGPDTKITTIDETNAAVIQKITSSMEETALAVDALLTIAKHRGNSLPTFKTPAVVFQPDPTGMSQGRNRDHSSTKPETLTGNNSPQKFEMVGFRGTGGLNSTEDALPNRGGDAVKVSAETTEKTPQGRFTEESSSLSASDAVKDGLDESIIQGVEFLLHGLRAGRHQVAWPIGFYFAKLWYHEKLYPHIFTASALGKFLRMSSETPKSEWPI